jgi:N-acetylneuraminic acid mutarotase
LKTYEWIKIESDGEVPSKREFHTSLIYKSKLFIFGGYDGKRLNDLYSYSIEKNKWKKIQTTAKPPSNREEMTSVLYNSSIYIFGGINFILMKDGFLYF